MRGAGLFLLAVGIVIDLVGVIGLVVALTKPGGLGFAAVPLFLAVAGVGTTVIVVGVVVMRRGRPIGARQKPVNGRVGTFLADAPEEFSLDGSPYTVHYTTPVPGKNGRPSSLRISTPVGTRGEIQVVRESWFDRLGSRLGIALEVQTGDEDFDRECYVRSDTPEFAAEYLTDPVKRVAIVDMRRLGFPEVTLKDGEASATWTGFDPNRHDRPDLALDAAARLVLLARNLPAERPEFAARVGAPRLVWQVVLWLGLIALALTLISRAAYPPVDGMELARLVAPAAVLGVFGFAVLTALLLRGTSTSHYAWGRLVLGSLILVPIGTLGTGTLLNGALDGSPQVVRDEPITDKYTARSKNNTRYYVQCTSWRDPRESLSFQVSSQEHDAVVVGRSRVIVDTHAGALGVEWRAGVRVEIRPK